MLRVSKELIQLVQRNLLVFVHIKFVENGLEFLVREEFFLVHASHHELVQLYLSISGAVRHCDQIVDFLLVEVTPVVLAISIQDFFSAQRAITRLVQILEDHLQLDCVLHVHKVLNQEAKGCLFGSIFGAKVAQVGQSARHIDLPAMFIFVTFTRLLLSALFKPGMLECFCG